MSRWTPNGDASFFVSSAREHVVNLPHNPFGPLHGSGNHLVGSRTTLRPAEQIVSHNRMVRTDSLSSAGVKTESLRSAAQDATVLDSQFNRD
jgi:hypothetical protein